MEMLQESLAEIQGQHHRTFVTPDYARSSDYRDFWARLGRGEVFSGEFLRIGKGGREVWIQASYNPIFDLNGKPYKVVKYATDITASKQMEFAIGYSVYKRCYLCDRTSESCGAYTANNLIRASSDSPRPIHCNICLLKVGALQTNSVRIVFRLHIIHMPIDASRKELHCYR
jgi:hypothetical protein